MFSTIPFEAFGSDLFAYNEYHSFSAREEMTPTLASLAGGSDRDETALMSGDEGEFDHWLQEHQDKDLSVATPPPLSPSQAYASPEYSREEGLHYLNPAQVEINSFRMAAEELDDNDRDDQTEQVSALKGEIIRLKEEVGRLNTEVIRVNVTVGGILSILEHHNMVRSYGIIEGT